MRILNLSIPSERGGCFHWRTQIPFSYMREQGHTVAIDHVSKKTDYNVVVVNQSTPSITGQLITVCREEGMKLVFDTDDANLFIEKTNFFHAIQHPRNKSDSELLLHEADLITVSTEPLRELYSTITTRPIVVLPNSIDLTTWQKRHGLPLSQRSNIFRIGWAGGLEHAHDLLTPLQALVDLQKDYDFELVMFGISRKLLNSIDDVKSRDPWYVDWSSLRELLKQVKHLKLVSPVKSYRAFQKTLATLDIDLGLAPLEESRSNRCKSAIKMYEYAAVGTPCLASRVTPYKEVTEYTVKNRYNDWKKKIAYYLDNEYPRHSMAAYQRLWVEENATIQKNGHLWEETYNNLLGGKYE